MKKFIAGIVLTVMLTGTAIAGGWSDRTSVITNENVLDTQSALAVSMVYSHGLNVLLSYDAVDSEELETIIRYSEIIGDKIYEYGMRKEIVFTSDQLMELIEEAQSNIDRIYDRQYR